MNPHDRHDPFNFNLAPPAGQTFTCPGNMQSLPEKADARFPTDIHLPQGMNLCDSRDPSNFLSAPPVGQHFHLSRKICQCPPHRLAQAF